MQQLRDEIDAENDASVPVFEPTNMQTVEDNTTQSQPQQQQQQQGYFSGNDEEREKIRQQIAVLQAKVLASPALSWTLDLEAMTFASATDQWSLAMDSGPRQMLLSGRWDATSQLLDQGEEVQRLMQRLPYLNGFITQ